jgi:hypothetical protein
LGITLKYMGKYNFSEHLHRYAVWTAARAVQCGLTSTKNIQAAIDKTGLNRFLDSDLVMSEVEFDKFHRETAKKLIEELKDFGLTYGQAAKIIAIYLKTSVIIRTSGKSELSKFIHPPIDHILLTNINNDHHELGLKGIKWTQLTETEYFDVIDKIRLLKFEYFWEVEQYWCPSQKE